MPLSRFRRDPDAGVLAGVCAGIARTLGVDPTLVRLVFALLTLAGGAGILLYLALWAYAGGWRRWPSALFAMLAAAALLLALGLSAAAIAGATLVAAGLATALSRGGSLRPGGSLPALAVVLAAAGAVVFLGRSGQAGSLLAPGAVAGALLLVVGPWVWRLTA